jgi:hypothetical protein
MNLKRKNLKQKNIPRNFAILFMKNKYFALLLLSFMSTLAISQTKVTLSGYVKDSTNGESLISASVYVKELGLGTTTNLYGFYSLNINPGTYTIVYSYVGYVNKEFKLSINQNRTENMELKPTQRVLEAANVKSDKIGQAIESTEMSSNKLNMKTIQKIPALLGEVDLVRSVQLLPGVTTVGEGASGFNVRGGSIDQNLILLDEAPVFNSSHLFGFFSVFNPDAVKDVKLIKGGIPATYGGRLSSLLDVRMKEGNSKKFEGSGGLGLVFSRLSLEGPLKKDKGSFILAGRRSYIDVLAKPFLPEDLSGSQFYFYDFTTKLNYTINKKNKIFASAYLGRDVFSASGIFGFDWGNTTVSTRWNKLYSSRLFSNVTAYYSQYDYRLRFGETDNGFDWRSNITNFSLKPEFTYYPRPNMTMNFGGQAIYYTFKPGTTVANIGGITQESTLPQKYSLENALYIDIEQKIDKKLTLRYGLRYSNFNYLGKGNAYYFRDTLPNNRKPLERVESFESFKKIADYNNLEPRLSVNYVLTDLKAIKFSYNRMTQYLHLISNTTASVPLDVWTPSTNNLPGQIADQVALGYFQNLKDDKWEFSVEAYYKNLQNQVEYIDGAELLLNERLEADLMIGKGRAYGMEFYVKKNSGKLTGWISYTLAWSDRQTEGINNAEWYPVRFDRRHNLNLVGIYELSEKLSLSANFVYYTGTPATFPTNKFGHQGYTVPINYFDARNNYRLPDYHRLDLSATYNLKKKKKWESNLVFSVYNVYARKNPFSIFFQNNPDNLRETQAVQFSILGTAVPAITYNFKF